LEVRALPPDHETQLNRRVWTLFEGAGFETQPNSKDSSEHRIELGNGTRIPVDLFARERRLNVTIIGSNKGGANIDGFHEHIAGLKELGSASHANTILFVATGRDLNAAEIRYVHQNHIRSWTERQLAYYESLAKAIGPFAKYEIIHSFGIPTVEQTLKVTVPALAVRQPRWLGSRSADLYAFSLPAETLLKISSVLRRARDNAFTYQRILSRDRLPRIAEFLKASDAILPTCIVAHLGADIEIDPVANEIYDHRRRRIRFSTDHHLVSLTIPLEYASLEIIDGQHRLFGFVRTSEKVRREFSLVVVGIRNLSTEKRSRTFVAINDKAKRVDPTLVSFLRYTDKESTCQRRPDLMAIKIAVELNKREPFRNAITLKGISGYDLKGMVGENGALRRYYPNRSATYVGVLQVYFGIIQEVFPAAWRDPATYIIATNRGVTAFLKLLRSILKYEEDRVEDATIRGYIEIIRRRWVRRTWVTARLDTSYSASQGWKQFHRDLVRTIRRERPDFRE
jgi:DGQHR domain-containing protein